MTDRRYWVSTENNSPNVFSICFYQVIVADLIEQNALWHTLYAILFLTVTIKRSPALIIPCVDWEWRVYYSLRNFPLSIPGKIDNYPASYSDFKFNLIDVDENLVKQQFIHLDLDMWEAAIFYLRLTNLRFFIQYTFIMNYFKIPQDIRLLCPLLLSFSI